MVSNNYTPYSGGVVSSLNAIVPQLQAHGHEVIIITLDFTGKHDDPAYVYRIKTCFKFLYRNNHMALPWRARAQLCQILTDFNPDLVHVHQPFLLGPMALSLCKKMEKKIVFTYHTLYHEYAHYVPAAPRKLTQKCIDLLVAAFCQSVDGIIIPTPGVRQFITPCADQKARVIPSPLQKEFLSPLFVPKVKKNYFSLLTVGRMVPEKNIAWLLCMFAKLDQTRFRFTLAGYGVLFEQLKSYAYQELKLSSESVYFVHKPSKSDMVALHKQADLFVFASQSDTQALVLAETMAHGTPVIALDGTGQRHIITQGANGYLVQTQNEMINRIAQVHQDDQLHLAMQKSAYQTSKRYCPKAVCKELENFYACYK